ncbi:MAG: hypothetical protein ACE5J7_03670 [Candidatus Aenigmatarchaeota archaeon]
MIKSNGKFLKNLEKDFDIIMRDMIKKGGRDFAGMISFFNKNNDVSSIFFRYSPNLNKSLIVMATVACQSAKLFYSNANKWGVDGRVVMKKLFGEELQLWHKTGTFEENWDKLT